MTGYLAPLSNQQLYELRQVVRSGFISADKNGWEAVADDCANVLLDTWLEMTSRLPNVYIGHLS